MSVNDKRRGDSKRKERVCLKCGKVFFYDESDDEMKKAFPFCSGRCKMADLDSWFTEDYKISRPIHPDDLEEEEAAGEE